MAEEMIEDFAGESDEALDTEADEAIAEAEDSAEAVNDRWRSRRRPGGFYRPGRGVQGITLRNQDGRVRNVPFPTKLATVAETNRGLATQEVARRALDDRLDRLEARFRVQQKRDSSVSGVVSLAIGVPLTAIGVFHAANQPAGSRLGVWASQEVTKIAAVTSATQLATTAAKLAFNYRYSRSGVVIAADVFAALQLTVFAFGSMQTEDVIQEVPDIANAQAVNFPIGTKVYDVAGQRIFSVIQTVAGRHFAAA
jgi:hypothetical protein